MNNLEEQIAFYHELGIAIATWASVEEALFNLVSKCVFPADRGMLSVGFFSIENFRSKLQFVESLLTMKFAGIKAVNNWPALKERLGKASAKRNKLAHRRVRIYPVSKPGRMYALVPWPTNTRYRGKRVLGREIPPPDAICLRDIVSMRLEFTALEVSLWNLSFLLEGKKEPFPKSDEQSGNPPTIRNLVHSLHAMLSRRDTPSGK